MNSLRMLNHIVRADFIERIRRTSFLIVLATTVFAGYLFVPPVDAGYRVLQVGVQRSVYNSAWIGLMFGLIAAMHLPFVGFILVKNAVERDRQTGVGEIIATTPTSKLVYVAGKWLSNLLVLALILIVLTAMAVVMQLVRAEDTTLDLWALVVTIWLMGLPLLALAAAMAVFFENVFFLRGGLGNVVFFLIWLSGFIFVLAGSIDEATGAVQPTSDLYGFTRQVADIQGQVLELDPQAEIGSGLVMTGRGIERTFVWDGFGWTRGVVFERLIWGVVAVVVALVAAIPFDRFDPARQRVREPIGERETGRIAEVRLRARRLLGDLGMTRKESGPGVLMDHAVTHLTPLEDKKVYGRLGALTLAELRLMLMEPSWWWFVGAAGLFIAGLLSWGDRISSFMLPAAWLWPIALWSGMCSREKRHRTQQLMFSTPHLIRRQLPALWLAGFLVALLTGGGVALRLMFEGQWQALLAWGVGAAFIPSLALALGTWSGGRRLFEMIYILWWYLGPVNQVAVLDYMGVSAQAIEAGVPIVYLVLSILLIGMAVVGRWRQLQIG